MKIIFSKHAERKIRERRVKKENVEKILKEPDFIFYDLHTRSLINIAKIEVEDVSTNLVVAYTKQETSLKLSPSILKILKEESKRRRWEDG